MIAGERKGQSAADLLAELRIILGPEALALSTVSMVELEHGVWRAGDAAQMAKRRRFFDDLFAAVPSHPLTFDIARQAARIDAESNREGRVIPHSRI